MSGPFIVDPKWQNAADSAFARQVWLECTKIAASKILDHATPSGKAFEAFPDKVTKRFIELCEQGFFDVKREGSK